VQQKYASATESPVDINAAEVHIICEDWGAAADLSTLMRRIVAILLMSIV
jgi:hypothetical protein